MKRVSIYRIALVREGSLSYDTLLGAQFTGTQHAAEILSAYLKDADREHFIVLFLNQKNLVTGIHTAHVGTLTVAAVSPREVFKAAVVANAARIVIAHNHPSGDAQPSPEDRAITQRMKESGKLLDIPLVDHLIIAYPLSGGYSYYSFAQENML